MYSKSITFSASRSSISISLRQRMARITPPLAPKLSFRTWLECQAPISQPVTTTPVSRSPPSQWPWSTCQYHLRSGHGLHRIAQLALLSRYVGEVPQGTNVHRAARRPIVLPNSPLPYSHAQVAHLPSSLCDSTSSSPPRPPPSPQRVVEVSTIQA